MRPKKVLKAFFAFAESQSTSATLVIYRIVLGIDMKWLKTEFFPKVGYRQQCCCHLSIPLTTIKYYHYTILQNLLDSVFLWFNYKDFTSRSNLWYEGWGGILYFPKGSGTNIISEFLYACPRFLALKTGKPFSCFQDIVKTIKMWLGISPRLLTMNIMVILYSPFTEHNEAEGVAN